jgi:penicillin-binding protein 2
MRIGIVKAVLAVIFLFIAVGVFNLQVLQGGKFKDLSDNNCIRLLPQAGSRGKILDRQGNVIVGNRLSYDAMVLPQDNVQINKTLSAMSAVLGVDFSVLKERFRKGYTASFMPVILEKNIDLKKASALGELKSDYGNIIIQPRPVRDYPYGNLACHVIGYLNEIDHWRLTKLKDYGYKTKDVVGFGGIEEKYDYYLRQEDGAQSFQVDHRGRLVCTLGFRPPVDGKDIQLTIDIKAQQIAEEALGDRKGSVILMEPYSGEIVAMVSRPAFEPALFVSKSSAVLANLSESALVNRAISCSYPAASIFKLVVASAGLETGKINLSTTYFCSGSIRIGNRQFKCWDVHHEEDLAAAIAHSCDVFFYKTGLLAGPQALHDYAVKFGFSKLTGLDLPYEISGFVPDPLWKKIARLQNWFDGDTANFAIGQGDLMVTPIQITRLVATFANGGILVRPYIVKNIAGKELADHQRQQAKIGIKKNIINSVRQDMRKVVTEPTGTANVLAVLPVSVAGKTGTAEAGGSKTHGWFAGFFPFMNPKFVICVFLENNGSGHAASVVAKQIIEGMAKENLI